MENNIVINIPKSFIVDEVANFRIKINKQVIIIFCWMIEPRFKTKLNLISITKEKGFYIYNKS